MPARILIVDDHPLTRDALATLLGQNGFQVVGQAGRRLLGDRVGTPLQPDLVLLDLSMPELDGLAPCRACAKQRRSAKWSC